MASAALALPVPQALQAQGVPVLDVASAGSIRAMLEGPLKAAAAQQLHLEIVTHAGGSDAMARAVVAGSVPADVFLPITARPMRTVLSAGKAKVAYPVAGTEMVILYSAKGRFAPQFAEAAAGKRTWWEVLEQPGLRFARSNPADDPGGRNILFSMMVAERLLKLPGLTQRVLGAPLNPDQVHTGADIRQGLESGAIDAAGSYHVATRLGAIPYLPLPPEVNLSDPHLREKYPDISLTINGNTFTPEPLFFYAAALGRSKNPEGATQFVRWLQGQEAAALFLENGFTLPGKSALPLR